MTVSSPAALRKIVVSELLKPEAADLQLRVLAGEAGLDRIITHERIQKPGLALAGFTEFVHDSRVQIFGSTELGYLGTLDHEGRQYACDLFCESRVAMVVCTKGMDIPEQLRLACDKSDTPLMTTPQRTSVFISRIEAWLADRLAPTTTMHGVLLDVHGAGVLLLGKSGIGKSECALDLVQRGHRLVADDLVRLKRRGKETTYGEGAGKLRHHMEIRGLGILNIRDLFGVAAVRDKKRLDLVVELVVWDEDEEYDRLGIEERRFPILDVEHPLLTVPVRPGRNMAAIVEVAARNQLLKSMGVHSAEAFVESLGRELAPGRRDATDDVD